MRVRRGLLLLLLALTGRAAAVTLGLRSDTAAYPFLYDLDSGSKLDWTRGRSAELLASSPATRVSGRGVRFVHRWFTVVRDEKLRSKCLRARDALCVAEESSLHVFPTQGANVVLGAKDCCLEAITGRTLRLRGTNDVSLCDIMSGSQHVLVTVDGGLERAQSMIGPILQGTFSALAVYVVGCIVHRIVGGESSFAGSLSCTLACVAIVTLVVLTHDPRRLYVTHQDFLTFVFLLCYTIFNLTRWSKRSYKYPRQPAPYSVCVGALNLLCFRLFATMDNPCSKFIMAFMILRVVQKLRLQQYKQQWVHLFDLYLDAALVGILCKYGFFTQYESLTLAAMHLTIVVTGILLLSC